MVTKDDIVRALVSGGYNFTLDEFCIEGASACSDEVALKIYQYHIQDLQKFRKRGNKPVIVSQRSGYRSPKWEKARGRSGNSQHCFLGKGAVDLVYYPALLKYLVEESEYTRIAYYPNAGFIHVDHRAKTKQLYLSDNASRWERVASLEMYY